MLDKKYNSKQVEENKYDMWLKNNYFKSGDESKKPFCIVLPPPNVTGKLHLGHAWDTALQDIIIRYKRMNGYDALWLPGMDHAAIATEVKVVNKLKSQGIDKYELGREKFLEKAWEWKHEYAENIRSQWAKMGLSLDYSKETFTLDEKVAKAVKKVFVDYYNKGYIYRGEKIINWDPVSKTALSNEEVIYKDTPGAFYHIKYFIEDSEEFLEVATTRPETLFGDTAVAVNPTDERYQKYIGKNVILPIVNKKIPVVADIHADKEFGTGVVKITPAHDPNDFEVGNRHNLERIKVLNPDGTMNENAGIYNGLDRFECREKLIKDLDEQGLLIEIEKINHSVGYSERTDVMVEPYLSKQWFVKMDELSKNVLDNQKNKDAKVNFIPRRFEKILNHWMEDCHDWCISRQLWWGHRIPAWYKDNEVYVGVDAPTGDGWHQDEDVLDTWFSSALWPFVTLGYPNNTKDLERYYPNDLLVTAYDIIFFWVARMIFQGLEITKERPFKDCLIHGLIRDKQGRKMSKSLGNGVDPIDVIEKYGADSLRFFLSTSSAPGMDLRYDEEKVASSWNFINKLWNASRFVLMSLEDFKESDYNLNNIDVVDKWILTRLNKTIKDTTKYMEKYEFNNASKVIYDFVWDDFCDNYIELSKTKMDKTSTKSVLLHVLTSILKLLHPFIPFVTEEIYMMLPVKDSESIMISSYPTYNKNEVFNEEESKVNKVIEDITAIRNLKANNSITKNAYVMFEAEDELLNIYKTSLKINEDNIIKESKDLKSYNYKSKYIDITYFEEAQELNLGEVKEQITKLEQSITRRKNLLSNENYVNKAPQNIVELDRLKLKEEEEKLENLKNLMR